MNDEIKEMLEHMESIAKTGKDKYGIKVDGYGLQQKGLEILLDYITNLQQENERLKNGYCELKVKCNNGECDCTNEEYDGMVQANMRISLLLDDYKSRCEKASEYIKNNVLYEVLYDDNGDYFNTTDSQATDDLLYILQNGSDDE